MTRGKFIVFEGGEGSGKTTALNYIRQRLGEEDFIYTREPGGTRVAEKIRELFLERQVGEEKFTPLTDLLLIAAARAQHMEMVVRPALLSGRHVLCDRFDLGTYAYQIALPDRHDLIAVHKTLLMIVCEGDILADVPKSDADMFKPDLYLYFDVDAEIGRLRARTRDGTLTSFDNGSLELYQAILRGYEEVISTLPDEKFRRIVASRSIEEVGEECLKAVRDFVWPPGAQ